MSLYYQALQITLPRTILRMASVSGLEFRGLAPLPCREINAIATAKTALTSILQATVCRTIPATGISVTGSMLSSEIQTAVVTQAVVTGTVISRNSALILHKPPIRRSWRSMTANSILIRHADRKEHQRTSFEIFEQHPTYRRYRSRGVEVPGTQDKIGNGDCIAAGIDSPRPTSMN